jgi:small subunit ribosomal protein S3
VREAALTSAEGIKSLKQPVRVISRSGVKLTAISQTALQGLIELQSEIVTSALTDAAVRLERAARADNVVDLLQEQAEALRATRDRIVDEASRAVAIFKHAGRDVTKVASQAYAKVVESDTEVAPAPRTTRKAKRPVRKAVRKTTARARKVAALASSSATATSPSSSATAARTEGQRMGQKVNPIGIRLGITREWTSKWYAGKKQFPLNVHTDFRVREFLRKRLAEASVSRILIERAANKVNITIQTARPGIVIGKKGEDIDKLRAEVAKLLGKPMLDVRVNIAEIRKPELDAQLVADGIAQQIEKRVMFRRAMKRSVMSTMRSGALGVKVRLSGRLNGSEIARTEWSREGRVPLHTFRADIDYGLAEARTTYGIIGVKVWIFKGEVFDTDEVSRNDAPAEVTAVDTAAQAAG